MKKITIPLLSLMMALFTSEQLFAATSVYDKENGVILMKNTVDFEEYRQFLNAVDEITKIGATVRLVVTYNLYGGLTYDALKIGEWISSHNIDVHVFGQCYSSCANYIFLAGKNKTLQEALIGYHGNPTETVKLLTGKDADNDYVSDEDLLRLQKYGPLTREKIISDRKYISQNEPLFFTLLGINQDIFSSTVNRMTRKKLGCSDEAQLYVLGFDEFAQYNIKNVTGTIGISTLKKNISNQFCLAPSLKKSLSK